MLESNLQRSVERGGLGLGRELRGARCPGFVVLLPCSRPKSALTTKSYIRSGLYAARETSHPVRCQNTQTQTQEPPSAEATISLKISTCHKVQFGEIVKVVGEGDQLGSWDPPAAPAMEWSEGDNWTLQLDLAPGAYDFKCVVARPDGSIAAWEPGSDRHIELEAGGAAVEVVCPWSNTSATLVESMDEDGKEGPTFEMDGARTNGHVEPQSNVQASVGAMPSRENGHQDRAQQSSATVQEVTAATGMDTASPSAVMEGQAPSLEQPQAASDETSAASPSSEATAAPSSTSKLPSSTSFPQPSSSAATSSEHDAGDASQASTSSARNEDSQNGAGSAPSAASQARSSYSDSRRDAASQPQAATEQPARGSSLLAKVAAGLGLLALPVVVWSEVTLAQTGCGLPPGPGGYLGAAEGVSYLAVAGLAVWSALSFLSVGPGRPAGGPSRTSFVQAVQGLSLGVVFTGLSILGYQYRTYGYIPSATPDAHCFGEAKARGASGASVQSQLQEGLAGFLRAPPAHAADVQRNTDKEKPVQERDLVQEMRDGAIDGLSAADLEAAGEQISRLTSYVFKAIEGLRMSVSKGVESAQDMAGSTVGASKPTLQSMAVIPSISLRHMLILQQTGFTAATTNAISTATHVNSTLGNTIQQLQQSVEEVEGVLPEVEAAVDGDATYDHKKNLLDLEHTVLALENVLGDASIAVDVDLSPLIGQLSQATAELKSYGKQDGLVKKLEHAVASLQGVQSLQKVKPTLLTAQQQVKKLDSKGRPQEDPKRVVASVKTAVNTMDEAASDLARAYVDVDASDVPPGSSASGSTGIAELPQESG
ncbi:hypothetical protein WJX74_001225 [Apatococcus lobatus]|uniref:CBM20 domain-containing protein n=1 Tax=Apatococcus lobatus TaxID=904363 RepID=A0AAW1RN44_9CHLO